MASSLKVDNQPPETRQKLGMWTGFLVEFSHGLRPKSMKKPDLCFHKPGRKVEAAGIAPASREASVRASTCVADRLIVGLGAPVDRVSFGLSCHEFNPGRNKRFGSGDPELSSPAEPLGRRPGARPLLWFRQRDGTAARKCRQLSFGRLFTRPADQPRHAAVHLGHPVDPGSPPNAQGYRRAVLIIIIRWPGPLGTPELAIMAWFQTGTSPAIARTISVPRRAGV